MSLNPKIIDIKLNDREMQDGIIPELEGEPATPEYPLEDETIPPINDPIDDMYKNNKKIYNSKAIIIFRNDFNISWNCFEGHNPILDYILGKTSKLQGYKYTKVKKIYWGVCTDSISHTLISAIQNNYTSIIQVDEHFKDSEEFIKEKASDERKTIHKGPFFEVYLSKKGTLSWWYRRIPEHANQAFAEGKRLNSIIRIYLNGEQRKLASTHLGWAIVNILTSSPESDPSTYLKDIEKFIYTRASMSAKLKHFIYMIVASILIFVAALFTYHYYIKINENIAQLIVGCGSGALGALISVIQRNDKIGIDFLAPFQNFITQGISRLFLGMIFGITMVLLIKSNLISVLEINSSYSISIFGIISGLSERFIPDFLDKVSSKALDSK